MTKDVFHYSIVFMTFPRNFRSKKMEFENVYKVNIERALQQEYGWLNFNSADLLNILYFSGTRKNSAKKQSLFKYFHIN